MGPRPTLIADDLDDIFLREIAASSFPHGAADRAQRRIHVLRLVWVLSR